MAKTLHISPRKGDRLHSSQISIEDQTQPRSAVTKGRALKSQSRSRADRIKEPQKLSEMRQFLTGAFVIDGS